jgi:hypothetical protein
MRMKATLLFLILILMLGTGCSPQGSTTAPAQTTSMKSSTTAKATTAASTSGQALKGSVKELAAGEWKLMKYTYGSTTSDYAKNPGKFVFEATKMIITIPNLTTVTYQYEWTGADTMTVHRDVAGGGDEDGTGKLVVEGSSLVVTFKLEEKTLQYTLAK